jgi:hypothetical protein
MLKRFQGEWPVDVIIQDYYSNLASTSKDKASGAYQRRRNRQTREEERSDEEGRAGRDDDDEDGGGGGGDDDKDDDEDQSGGGGGSRDEGEAGDTDAVADDPYSWRRRSEELSVSGRGGSDDEGGADPGEWLLTFASIAYHLTEGAPATKRRRLNNGKLIIL